MKPAVKWGLIGGFLSAIPFLNCFNLVCCAWAWLVGIMIAKEESAGKAEFGPGDGVRESLLGGGVAAVIYLVVGIPLGIFFGAAMLAFMSKMTGQDFPVQSMGSGMIGQIVQGLVIAVFIFGFAVAGGAAGGLMFKKPKG